MNKKTNRISSRNRLTQLVKKMSSVEEQQFDYSTYVKTFNRKHNCATIACLAGWLPAVFPKEFKWVNQMGSYYPYAINNFVYKDVERDIRKFFFLNKELYDTIFVGKGLTVNGYVLMKPTKKLSSVTLKTALKRIDKVVELSKTSMEVAKMMG